MSQQYQARKEIEAALVAKAQAEPAFRQVLLKNGKAAIEKEFGVSLPARIDLKVVEETAATNYLVLPAATGGELSDADLDAAAGGWCISAIVSKVVSVLSAGGNDTTGGVQKDKMQSANKQAEAVRGLL